MRSGFVPLLRLASLLVACAAATGGAAQIPAAVGSLPIRRVDVTAAQARPSEGTTRADLARTASLLQRRLVARLGPRYAPRTRAGARLAVALSAVSLPTPEGLALGTGGGEIKGEARLLGARGEVVALVPLAASVPLTLRKPPTSVTGLLIGTASRLARTAVRKRDGPDELAERAAAAIVEALAGRG